jgi:hypothetical protein
MTHGRDWGRGLGILLLFESFLLSINIEGLEKGARLQATCLRACMNRALIAFISPRQD